MNWAPTVKVCEDLASQDRDSYCKILELGCCQVWISKISLPPLDHKVVDELREMKEKVWGAWRPLGTIVSYLGVWYMLIKFLIASVAAWLRLCDDGMNNLYCTFQRWTFVLTLVSQINWVFHTGIAEGQERMLKLDYPRSEESWPMWVAMVVVTVTYHRIP